MKLTRFLSLALMIKYTSKAMDMMDQLLVFRTNHKKAVILITIQNSFFVKEIVLTFSSVRAAFCQRNCFNFQSNQDSFFDLAY